MFVFGVISIELWHTEFPVWAFVLSLAIGESRLTSPACHIDLTGTCTAFAYCIPVGMIQAITNQKLGLK